jgi:energy-coupling factor transporter ATP-binding protein EcfA2
MSLRLEAVQYGYAGGGGPVLDGIDLVLEPGRVLGIVGANDSGKSTLCLVAAGIAPATIGGRLEGRVTIDDMDTKAARPHEVAQRAGILFQNANTQLSGIAPTVWEEVAFGPRNLSLPLDEVIARVEAALDALGIAELAPRDPQRLSGGQAQLVALAAVLALRPAYLVLDEPTSQLDPEGTHLVGDALARTTERTGAGILIVEHKADLLELLAEDVAVLDRGRISLRGPGRDILADPAIEALGVSAPSRVRLQRAAQRAGVTLPELAA